MSQAIVPRRVCPPAQQYAARSWLCDWRRPQDTRQTLAQLSCTRKPEALDGPLLPEKKTLKAQHLRPTQSFVSLRSMTSPTFFIAVVSSSGSSTSKPSSKAITDSTMSRLSAPSSESVASRVTFSLSTPSCSAMMSATLPMVSAEAAERATAPARAEPEPRSPVGAAPATKPGEDEHHRSSTAAAAMSSKALEERARNAMLAAPGLPVDWCGAGCAGSPGSRL